MAREGKAPAFQFYAADWLADSTVMRMSCAQRGAYINLLCVQWRERTIPDDAAACRRLAGAGVREWKHIWPAMLTAFEANNDGTRSNKRLLSQQNSDIEFRTERSDSGAKGAKAHWAKHGSAIQQPLANHSSASASASASASQKKKSAAGAAPPPPKEKLPAPIGTYLDALHATSRGRVVVAPMTTAMAIRTTAIVRELPDLADWKLAGEWIAAGGLAWMRSPPGLPWLATDGQMAHAVGLARSWVAGGRGPAEKPKPPQATAYDPNRPVLGPVRSAEECDAWARVEMERRRHMDIRDGRIPRPEGYVPPPPMDD